MPVPVARSRPLRPPHLVVRAAAGAASLAGLLVFGAAARADAPPRTTAGERAAIAGEDANQPVTAADLAPAPGAAALAGKPIVRVETVTVGALWPSQERVTKVRPGELWSGEAARRAVREMLDTGRFARAGVEAYPEGDGVVIRLSLLPRRVIASITVSGGALDRGETLDASGILEGGEVTATSLDVARARIAALYASRGFPRAIVHADATDTDDPDRAVVSIEIEPGSPLLLEKRVFTIDPVVQAEVGNLRNRYKIRPGLNFFEEILNHVGFHFTPGVRADEPTLSDADRELAEVLKQNGFPRAEVKHRVVRNGAQAVLDVRILSGPRIVPVFDGNRAFDADALAAALDISKGDASRPAELADRLRDFYVKRGFFDVEIDATERGDARDAVHYIAFRIHENRRVRVAKRVFPCFTGDLSPDDVGAEIDTFLEEDLPRNDGFSSGDPAALLATFGPVAGAGNRPAPLDINPRTTFAPASYDRALKHLKDLFYSKGYLNAVVGPVSLLRARCDPRKSADACVPEELPRIPPRCDKDDLGLPVPEPKVPASHRCEPDPAHGVECAPEVTVVLPIHLGPRSVLYDVAFEGNHQETEDRLAKIAALSIGKPLSSTELDAARQRVLDAYLKRGYAYAEVHTSIEPSPDRTRARAKFTINEHEVVMVTGVVVKGAKRTDEDLILSRVALRLNQPYRQELARLSEERIAQLGTFTSVALSLEDPEVPQRNKRVVVTVVEQVPQFLEPRVGFSTGEGFRFAFEYGHRNLGGRAVAGSLRLQLSYLPDALIPRDLLPAYQKPPLDNIAYRLERRNALSLNFPDVGLGPQVRAAIDLIDVNDLQRDYKLGREALIPSVTWRPNRQLSLGGSLSAEYNDVFIFNPAATTSTLLLLKVPEGQTVAFSQRAFATYDGRNNPFAATRGILIAGSAEHVNAFATGTSATASTSNVQNSNSHFVKLSGKISGYIPLGIEGVSLALSVSGGYNWKFEGETYPDRLFFLGGVDTVRSFAPESVVPQDIADCIVDQSNTRVQCYKGQNTRIAIEDVAIRGGDLMMLSRIELRFPLPVSSSLQGGIFLDAGNLWKDPTAIRSFDLRYGLGIGLRIATPIGPIAFDYGFNLRRYAWEDVGAPNFSIGLF
jgi:outer membrane protein assembly factor BamA